MQGFPSKGGAPGQVGGAGPFEAGAPSDVDYSGSPGVDYGGSPGEIIAGAGGAPDAERDITLITSGESVVHEAYGKVQFQLVLTAPPVANVEVGLKSTDTSRATVSPV